MSWSWRFSRFSNSMEIRHVFVDLIPGFRVQQDRFGLERYDRPSGQCHFAGPK